MCLQIPGKVISIKGSKAIVDYDIEKKEAIIADTKCSVGDYVLVVGRFIEEVVSEDAGRESLANWKKMMLD